MDDFNIYGSSYEEVLHNLERVFHRCETHNLYLSYQKYFMLVQEGIMLGHNISTQGIRVDTNKITIIK